MVDLLRLFYYFYESKTNLKKSREELNKLVNKKLRYMIKYSYENVRFYKKLFQEHRIDPSDISKIDDLDKIPLINKKKIKENPLKDIISVKYLPKNLHFLKTGGSTGEPFTTYISDREKEWRLAIFLRANMNIGQKMYDKWATIDDKEKYEKHRSFPFFPHISIPLSWDPTSQINILKKYGPKILGGLSSSLWTIARSVKAKGTREISPRLIFGTGELVSPSYRDDMEKNFDSNFFDQVSCTEVGRTAWECNEKSGYHMNSDSVVTQFVNRKGDLVSSGERGEIIYTSLHNFAMPIIRYNIHDIGVPIDDECACGLKLPLMKMMEGRHNSFIVLPGDQIISPWKFIETVKLYLLADEVEKYKIIQERKDLIEVQIVKVAPEVEEEKIREWIKNNLKKEFIENGVSLSDIEFRVKFVKSIPASSRGKLNVITSKLSNIPIL